MRTTILAVLLISLIGLQSTAQQDTTARNHAYVEAGTFVSTSSTVPFWLRSNQYGIVPNKAPIVTFRGGTYYDYDKQKPKKYDWGYGIDAAVNIGAENKIYLPEAYVKVKLNKFEFYAGRRREIFGLVDTTLTSGSYIWSGNALPMPKIQLSIPEYLPLKFTNNFIAIKGSYAHGWFDNSGIIKDVYLHHKSFYTRIGKPNWKVKMYAGFNHEVQWGGKPSITLSKGIVAGEAYPSSLKDYWYVITGFSLNNLTPTQQASYLDNDAFNRVGNHLGTIDLGIEFNFDKYKIMLYRQNLYETGSLFYLSNISDGLNGISFTSKNELTNRITLKKITLEWLNTTNQGGNLFIEGINELRGNNNYFNHGQYLNGWSYLQTTIGTPFIAPYSNLNSNLPTLIFSNTNYHLLFSNNRLNLINLSLLADSKNINLSAKLSYSKNYGSYLSPYNIAVQQLSSWFDINYKKLKVFNNFKPSLQIAFDNNGIYPANLGIFVSLKKCWN